MYDFMCNGFTETIWLLSEDTQVETQIDNIKLQPILYEKKYIVQID